MPGLKGKAGIKDFLLKNVGRKVTTSRIKAAAGDQSEYARRLRELRNEEGWPISSHNDDPTNLKPGEYRLEGPPPSKPKVKFARTISQAVRARVLERNGFTCQHCGIGAGEADEIGKSARLHVGHVVPKTEGGTDDPSNLRTLCTRCNQGAKNLTAAPPSLKLILATLRKANMNDRIAAHKWLIKTLPKELQKVSLDPKHADWLSRFPLRNLMQIGIIPSMKVTAKTKEKIAHALLEFFGVKDPEEWESRYTKNNLAFRRKPNLTIETLIAWLRAGELKARKIDLGSYSKGTFLAALRDVRGMTTSLSVNVEKSISMRCAAAGVAVVAVPGFKSLGISGITRWLDKSTPMIQLALHGKLNDRFWFSFFHEAGHVVLHQEKLKSQTVFVETDAWPFPATNSKEDREADSFAEDMLIPPKEAAKLRDLKAEDIPEFAIRIGAHPGIVVGRMQHEGILQYNQCNELKVRVEP